MDWEKPMSTQFEDKVREILDDILAHEHGVDELPGIDDAIAALTAAAQAAALDEQVKLLERLRGDLFGSGCDGFEWAIEAELSALKAQQGKVE